MEQNVNNNPFVELIKRYRNDPVKFAIEVIGIEPDDWQKELLRAVADPKTRRVTCRSGHGVGKSTAVAMAAIWHVLMRVPSKTVVTAPTSAQLFRTCTFSRMSTVLNLARDARLSHQTPRHAIPF